MSDYPLNHFLKAQTFRKMIELKMPDTAAGIQKNRERVARSAANSDELHLLES